MQSVGRPLGAQLDKSEAEIREALRQLGAEDVVEGSDARDLEAKDAAVFRQEVVLGEVAGGGVHADRQVVTFGFRVYGVEVAIAGELVALDPAPEDSASAVLRAEADFLDRGVDRHRRRYEGPA